MLDRRLPDTNAVIAYFANDTAATAQFEAADEIFACSIVLGELYYGARNSNRVAANVARVDTFAATNEILECDLETARQFGLLKATLRPKGRMIPDNDGWIAAAALQHSLTLLTNDAHFREIEGLSFLGW